MIAKKLRIFHPRHSNFRDRHLRNDHSAHAWSVSWRSAQPKRATDDRPRDFFSIVARVSSAHANFLRDGRRNVVPKDARCVLVVCMHVHLVVCISCVRGAARVCVLPGASFWCRRMHFLHRPSGGGVRLVCVGGRQVHFWSVGWPFLVVQVVIF